MHARRPNRLRVVGQRVVELSITATPVLVEGNMLRRRP
jgi:hypothetical protein